jgi:hypothetical protein
MSVQVNNASIVYGGTAIITVTGLLNISITPNSSVTDTTDTSNGVIYTVQPTESTLYYIKGYNTLQQQINLNITVYVNVTLLNNIIIIPYNTSQEITVYGSSSYSWSPTLYLTNINSTDDTDTITSSSVICTPLEDIIYTILGTDSFNTLSRTYLKIIVSTGLVFTPNIPTVYDGNLLNLSVYYNSNNLISVSGNIDNVNNLESINNFLNLYEKNNISNTSNNQNISYTWKSKLFNTLPVNCIDYKYGNNITLHPYTNQEYKVTAYQNNTILTSGNIKINVIEKPMNIIDIDIIPYILYKSVISRDKKSLIKLLKENKQLSQKIINFYYNILQTAYRMLGTNKSGNSFSVKWTTLYQIINESNEMILNFNQQWKFFQYINYHQTRNNITPSNFAYLLNTINQIYLEDPQKIGIYPLLSG